MIKVYGRLALIALLVFAGVSFWYGRVEERLQEKIPPVQEEAATLSAQKPAEPEPVKTDYQVILTRNIFKAALEPSGEQPQADVEDLEETTMQLVLLGTVSGSKEDARAIIRDEKAKLEDIYHIGSELREAIITRIGRGTVVLQVNGREEVLNIKDPGNSGPRQVASPAAVIPQTDAAGDRRVPVVVPQRRISFRNTTPAAQDAAATEPDEVPEEEIPLPETGEEDNTDPQNAQ